MKKHNPTLRKIIAGTLSILTLMAAMPTSAAEYTSAVKTQSAKNNAATITKSAEWDDPQHKSGNFDATITVSANVKPQSTSTSTTADIVLILDVSGSLARCKSPGHYDLSTFSTDNPNFAEWAENSAAVKKTFSTYAGYSAGNYNFNGTEAWPLLNADGSNFAPKKWQESKGKWYILPRYSGMQQLNPKNFYAVIDTPSQYSNNPSFYGHVTKANGKIKRISKENSIGEFSVARKGPMWEKDGVHNAVYTDNCLWAEQSSNKCNFGYDDAERAANKLIDELGNDSSVRIAIVPFSGVAESYPFTSNSSTLKTEVAEAYASLGYHTNYDGAWTKAKGLLESSSAESKFCIFMTDGACDMGNETEDNFQNALNKTRELKKDNTTIYAVGFGTSNEFVWRLGQFDSSGKARYGDDIEEIFAEVANSIGSTIHNDYSNYNVIDEISEYFSLISVETGSSSGDKWISNTYNAGSKTGDMKLHIRLKDEYQNPEETAYYPTNLECSVNYGKAKLPVATPVLEVPPSDGEDSGGGSSSGALWVLGIEPDLSYKAGHEVISSFYVGSNVRVSAAGGTANVGFTGKKLSYNGHTDTTGSKNTSGCLSTNDIQDYEYLSSQLGTVTFTASCDGKTGYTATKQNVYIPYAMLGDKNNGNLVYFKWTVPNDWKSGTVTCKATIKSSYSYERFKNKAERHEHTPGYWGGEDEDGDGSGDTWIPAKYDYKFGEVYNVSMTKNPSGTGSFKNSLNPKTHSETPDTTYEAGRPTGWTESASHSESSKKSASWKIITSYSGAAESQFSNGNFVRSNYGATIDMGASSSVLESNSLGACDNSGYAQLKPYKKQMVQDKSTSGGKTTYTTRSGYGFEIGVLTDVRSIGSTAVRSDMVTPVQEVWAEFPEYNYSTNIGDFRTLERIANDTADNKSLWHFEQNPWTNDNARCHFIRLWQPDGEYKVNVKSTECWTPAGVLQRVDNNNLLMITGSLYDDWHIQRGPQKYDIYGNPIV